VIGVRQRRQIGLDRADSDMIHLAMPVIALCTGSNALSSISVKL